MPGAEASTNAKASTGSGPHLNVENAANPFANTNESIASKKNLSSRALEATGSFDAAGAHAQQDQAPNPPDTFVKNQSLANEPSELSSLAENPHELQAVEIPQEDGAAGSAFGEEPAPKGSVSQSKRNVEAHSLAHPSQPSSATQIPQLQQSNKSISSNRAL